MSRPGPDSRERLQEAALELYREHGFDRTTTAQIAARAGVTERTFFRYFPDKREVLFDGEGRLQLLFLSGIAAVPAEVGPLETLHRLFRGLLPVIEANRPFAEPRHAVIRATAALQEREFAKLEALTMVLATMLGERGTGADEAILAARIGMAAFSHATVAWMDDPSLPLSDRLDQAFQSIRRIAIA